MLSSIYTRLNHLLALAAVAFLLHQPHLLAQTTSSTIDSDQDGLSDELEQSLLQQFAPAFMIAKQDCSNIPAEFVPAVLIPTVAAENGTIYGQASPARNPAVAHQVELHYYHLWKQDCGPNGHHLDTEHVSALIQSTTPSGVPEKWKAIYWYAAAHENTVCEASQITRASTLKAEDHGATVWISPGKHASFLNQTLCRHGCGADRCEEMKPLAIKQIVNIGELDHPMNRATWVTSTQWPLSVKMARSDFPATPIARLETLPSTDIAWFIPGRHPTQRAIAAGEITAAAIAASGNNTASALNTSSDNTLTAISIAGDSTDNALRKSYRKTIHALGTSARHVGEALHVTPKPQQPLPTHQPGESANDEPQIAP